MRSWLDEIRAAAPTVVIVLVGNKCTTMNAQRARSIGECLTLASWMHWML